MIGRNIEVGVGKESARGTSVAPLYWLPTLAPTTIQDKKQYENDVQSFGNIADSDKSVIVKEWAEGEINGKVRDRSFGLLLLNMFGAVTSTAKSAPNAVVYDHVFAVQNGNQHQALTFAKKDSLEQFRYALGMISSLKIKAEIGKYLEFSASIKAKKGVSGADTPSYITTENEFFSRHCTFRTAADLGSLGAASDIPVKSFEITLDQGIEELFSLGTTEPTDFQNTEFSAEVNIEAEYTALADFKTPHLAGTMKAMRLKSEDTTTTIGTSANPGLTFELSKVSLQAWERNGGHKDIIRQSIRGKAHYSLSDALMIRATLTNLVTSY